MSTEPKDIAFNNASKNRDHNIYTEEYYGGADCFIYIENTRVEDISALQFQIRETVKPIYGYSSRIYDDLAIGTRIVQGVIKVPVKNTGNADTLTTAKNSGTNSLTSVSTASGVPDWVYKYKPATEDVGTSNIGVNKKTDTDSVTIAQVQEALKKIYPAVSVSGVIDATTKDAIQSYKRSKGLVVNSEIDGELINRLLPSTKNIVYALGNCTLKYQPSNTSLKFYNVTTNARMVIQDTIGDWILVQVDDGSKGYIKKGEYYGK